MEYNSDDAVHAASLLVLFAVILLLAGWWTDKFTTMTGQIVGVISIFFGGWGGLTLKNPDKYGGIAIKIIKGLSKVGENAAGPTNSKKTDTTFYIGTVHGDLNQNVNSKKGKITTGKKKKTEEISDESENNDE